MSNLDTVTPTIRPIEADAKIHKFRSKVLNIRAVVAELNAAHIKEIEFIIGMIIAIKVSGIINCNSRNCGNS